MKTKQLSSNQKFQMEVNSLIQGALQDMESDIDSHDLNDFVCGHFTEAELSKDDYSYIKERIAQML